MDYEETKEIMKMVELLGELHAQAAVLKYRIDAEKSRQVTLKEEIDALCSGRNLDTMGGRTND